jgi:hypothetical protein
VGTWPGSSSRRSPRVRWLALGGDIILAGSPFKMSVLRAGKILELTGMSR